MIDRLRPRWCNAGMAQLYLTLFGELLFEAGCGMCAD